MTTQEEKPMKLISMVSFINDRAETSTMDMEQFDWCMSEIDKLKQIRNYADFLSQPLTLGMFVPVDEYGNVLGEPVNDFRGYDNYSKRLSVFEEAKDKVLFGELDAGAANHYVSLNGTVEYLAEFGTLNLTQTAKNQIFQ